MTLEDLAAIRHEEMAPLDPKEKITEALDDGRSQYRISFCQKVAREASKIAYSMAMQDSWRKRFVQENEPTVRESIGSSRQVESLNKTAEKLIGNLKKFRRGNTVNPPLVVVFDEATNLFSNTGSDNIDTGRYVALNRVPSCLRKLPIWFFMLSTESRVEKLLPAEKVAAAAEAKGIDRWSNPSGRRPPSFTSGQIDDPERLRLFPPFVSFRLDIEDRKRMQEPKSKAEELSKPMTDFLKAKHIAMFGRPLWFAYNGPDKLHKVAEWKLLGGGRGARFDPRDKHHVLAVLSFRLSLDVCVENPVSLDLVRTAVNSHLRVVVSMDQRTGVLSTATPSEPVLALAAMRLLCRGNNWTTSIKTLTGELLQQGLVAKGIKGELFARLVMTLASDQVRLDLTSQEEVQASEEWDQELEEEDSASKEEHSVKSTFMVYDFLKSLFAEKHHALIQEIPEQILNAKMNFTHFVAATEHLSPSIFPDLCHDLLRRNAALQLCENQATYDQLIPIYFGDDQKPFDPSQCGVVLIQNKNQKRATSLYSIFKERFITVRQGAGGPSERLKAQKATKESIREGPYFVFNNMANPILFLLFDTGVRAIKSALLEVSHSISDKDPQVWAVHSRGHTPETFGCLKRMDSAGNAKAFFASVMENVGIYADIARENVGFGRLARQFRYAKIEDDGEKSIALDVEKLEDIGGDRDTPMPDA
ncbi:MAG: hypothetical protein M1813_002626 [Trichoglossum hirsutum]|nr:MAG: hypothetical protein M1813_002626 [Trichoglossum hirsutum]